MSDQADNLRRLVGPAASGESPRWGRPAPAGPRAASHSSALGASGTPREVGASAGCSGALAVRWAVARTRVSEGV